MNKKVPLLAVAGALCCGMGISRADGHDASKATPQQPQAIADKSSDPLGDVEYVAGRAITDMAVAEQLGKVQPGQVTGEALTPQIPSLYRKSITDMTFADTKIGALLYSYHARAMTSRIRSPGTVLSAVQKTSYAADFGVGMSLVQYAQNQRLIDQNDKIIDLLTQLVHKK